jgi:hypothetical protein
MPAPYTKLDANQVLKHSFDEAEDRLRVDATISATIGDVTIVDSTSGDPLKVNADGSINVNVDNIAIDASTDSIAIGQGANRLTVNPDGSINVNDTNPSIGSIGSTAPSKATEMGAVDNSGNLQSLKVDPSGKLLVDITGTSTVTGTVNASIEGLNAFQTSQYAVGLSAVQLTPTPLTNRSSMSIKALTTSGNIIYVGNSNTVTTSTGYPLFNGDSLQIDLTGVQVIWAIASAAAQKVAILEIG